MQILLALYVINIGEKHVNHEAGSHRSGGNIIN